MDTMRSRAAATVRTVWSATALLLSLAAVLGVLAGALIAPASGLAAGMALTGLAAAIGRRRRHVWLPGLLLVALALGQAADAAGLVDPQREEELATARRPPPSLAHEDVGDAHARGFPWALEEHVGGRESVLGHTTLEVGSGQANLVGPGQGL